MAGGAGFARVEVVANVASGSVGVDAPEELGCIGAELGIDVRAGGRRESGAKDDFFHPRTIA